MKKQAGKSWRMQMSFLHLSKLGPHSLIYHIPSSALWLPSCLFPGAFVFMYHLAIMLTLVHSTFVEVIPERITHKSVDNQRVILLTVIWCNEDDSQNVKC